MTDTNGLASALAELQTKLPKIGKAKTANTGTYSYAFADLAAVSAQVLPIMGKLGLSFTCRPTFAGDRFVLAYRLWHTSGDMLEGEYPLPTGTPQTVGSAITYGRRYVLCSITGIAPDDDDDGAAATAHADQQRATKQRQSAYTRGSEADRPVGDSQLITTRPKMLAKLQICLKDYGITDRDAGLAYYADVIGREVGSSKELTVAEASRIIDRLTAELGKGTDVAPAEPDPTLDEGYQP